MPSRETRSGCARPSHHATTAPQSWPTIAHARERRRRAGPLRPPPAHRRGRRRRRPACRSCCSRLVGNDDPEAGRGQGADLPPPPVPEVGKAVQEDDGRTPSGPASTTWSRRPFVRTKRSSREGRAIVDPSILSLARRKSAGQQDPPSNRACGFPAHGLRVVSRPEHYAAPCCQKGCSGSGRCRADGEGQGCRSSHESSARTHRAELSPLAFDAQGVQPPPHVSVELLKRRAAFPVRK